MQIVITKHTNSQNHIWLNSLNQSISKEQTVQLLHTTDILKDSDDKLDADSVWEIVARKNQETIRLLMEDDNMCEALEKIMSSKIDAKVNAAVEAASSKAFNNGFDNGINKKGMQIFCNMINRGFPREEAQALAEISDELVERALENNG